MNDEGITLLRQILAGQQRILELLERGRLPDLQCDRDTVANVLREIHAAVGDCAFTSADLADHAELLDRGDLRDVLGSTDPRRVGKLLAKMAGATADGLTLVREGANREGACWRIAGVRE